MPLRFSLREHKTYATYDPDFTFTKPTATILRQTTTNASLGNGWIFIVVPRTWLHGKYVRWNWEGYASFAAAVFNVYIYDGEYGRSSDTDFPSGSGIPTKGNGLLQTLRSKTGTFAAETVDVQANVAGGSQDKCTIFFSLGDGWSAQNFWEQIDWFQINGGAGGANPLYDEQFTASITMERTGTTGDYGYISSGEVPARSVTTLDAGEITQTSGKLRGETGASVDERGFEWGIQSGVYPNSWTEIGSFPAETFSHVIDGLTEGVTYYYRAKCHDSEGWLYGNEKSFTPSATQVELRFSDVAPPTSDPPRSIYTDLVNLPDPVYLGLTVRIFNYDDVALYMRVDGYATGWSFTTNDLGSLASGGDMYRNLDNLANRAKPASATTQQITVRLRAYTDSGYTNLKWTFERVVDVVFVKSDDGSWTLDVNNNFDDGTVQGWAVATEENQLGGYPLIQVRTDFVLSTPYSIRMVLRYNDAHTMYNQGLYIRRDGTLLVKVGEGFRGLSGSSVVYIGDLIPINRWLRIVAPLPGNTALEVQIADECNSYYPTGNLGWRSRARLYKSFTTPNRANVFMIFDCRPSRSGADGYLWMDDFRIISKD